MCLYPLWSGTHTPSYDCQKKNCQQSQRNQSLSSNTWSINQYHNLVSKTHLKSSQNEERSKINSRWHTISKLNNLNRCDYINETIFQEIITGHRLSHVAYLRHVKECVEVAVFGRNYRPFLAQVVPPFTTGVSGGDTWRCKQERLKTRVCTISLRLQCIRGHWPPGPYYIHHWPPALKQNLGGHKIKIIARWKQLRQDD